MLNIQFPYYPFKIKADEGKELIFDEVRKKWVRLTPEEWVRQNFLQYLIHVITVPAKWIAVEKEIMLGELRKRFDIVVMNASMQPQMLIECKATHVPITDEVLQQVLRYNISLPSVYLVVTNGNNTYAFEKKQGTLHAVDKFPSFR
jgi:hypothetical protein